MHWTRLAALGKRHSILQLSDSQALGNVNGGVESRGSDRSRSNLIRFSHLQIDGNAFWAPLDRLKLK
jgi:hypothetical protein